MLGSTTTADPHRAITLNAIALLKRDGVKPIDGTYSLSIDDQMVRFDIALSGPYLPDDVPAELASPDLIRKTIDWRGNFVLQIRAPRPVFEIEWSPGQPVRIMAFSRGDWEADLERLSG